MRALAPFLPRDEPPIVRYPSSAERVSVQEDRRPDRMYRHDLGAGRPSQACRPRHCPGGAVGPIHADDDPPDRVRLLISHRPLISSDFSWRTRSRRRRRVRRRTDRPYGPVRTLSELLRCPVRLGADSQNDSIQGGASPALGGFRPFRIATDRSPLSPGTSREFASTSATARPRADNTRPRLRCHFLPAAPRHAPRAFATSARPEEVAENTKGTPSGSGHFLIRRCRGGRGDRGSRQEAG
jgi:hypothetical protein